MRLYVSPNEKTNQSNRRIEQYEKNKDGLW